MVLLISESWDREGSEVPSEETLGVDLASAGIVVVRPAWRLGAFGLFTTGSAAARGNLALLDQYMALVWVRENVAQFGGDPSAVTLLGHAAGATAVLHHLASPRTKGLFHRAVLMSPPEPWRLLEDRVNDTHAQEMVATSRALAARLDCLSETDQALLRCMQQRTAETIVAAYDALVRESGVSLEPTSDSYLSESARYTPQPLWRALRGLRLPARTPILFGVTDLEAVGRDDLWWYELVSRGSAEVLHHATHTAIPALLRLHRIQTDHNLLLLTQAVLWEYWGDRSGIAAWEAGAGLARAESAARWDSGAARLADTLAGLVAPHPLFVYRYTQPGGVDLQGNSLNFTGAAHGTALVAALGTTLLQSLARRRPSPAEARLARLMRCIADFARTGSPLSGRAREEWPPYRPSAPHVHQLRLHDSDADGDTDARAASDPAAFWTRHLPALANASADTIDSLNHIQQLQSTNEGSDRLRGAVVALASVSAGLLLLLTLSGYLLRRAAAARGRS